MPAVPSTEPAEVDSNETRPLLQQVPAARYASDHATVSPCQSHMFTTAICISSMTDQTMRAPCTCRRADTGRPMQQIQIDSSGNARVAGGRSPQPRISVQAPPPPPPHFARCAASSGCRIFRKFGSCMRMLLQNAPGAHHVCKGIASAEHEDCVAQQGKFTAPGLSRG